MRLPIDAKSIAAADFKKLEKRLREGADMRFEIKSQLRIAEKARLTLTRPVSKAAPVQPGDFSALIESDGARERVFASSPIWRQPSSWIDIADVVNPKRIRLTFEVHCQRGNGEKLLLGSFALYPPDNPGKFIVATRGCEAEVSSSCQCESSARWVQRTTSG